MNSSTRIGVVAVVAVAIFSWINRKTVKLNVKPFN